MTSDRKACGERSRHSSSPRRPCCSPPARARRPEPPPRRPGNRARSPRAPGGTRRCRRPAPRPSRRSQPVHRPRGPAGGSRGTAPGPRLLEGRRRPGTMRRSRNAGSPTSPRGSRRTPTPFPRRQRPPAGGEHRCGATRIPVEPRGRPRPRRVAGGPEKPPRAGVDALHGRRGRHLREHRKKAVRRPANGIVARVNKLDPAGKPVPGTMLTLPNLSPPAAKPPAKCVPEAATDAPEPPESGVRDRTGRRRRRNSAAGRARRRPRPTAAGRPRRRRPTPAKPSSRKPRNCSRVKKSRRRAARPTGSRPSRCRCSGA